MKEKVKYYEVEFDHDIRSREHGNETIGFYSICIRAMREPSYEEAEEFLEECMAVVVKNIKEVKEYLDESGMDVEGMSKEELLEASEIFSLPDGTYLIVEG